MTTSFDSRRVLRQSGMAMVVVLVFLLALTAISLYGARQAICGEKIARNALDAQVAFQAAEAALRDAEADLRMPEGQVLHDAVCTRQDQRPIKDRISLIVSGATCLTGICKLQDAQYANLDPTAAQKANNPQAVTGAPWWSDQMGGRWNNDVSTKPPVSPGQCATFTGGVPLGTFTGTHAIPGIARQPEYLIEYMGMRNASALFRVTARGFGYDADTQAMVQSYVLLAD